VRERRQASQYARSLIEASLDPLVTISPEGKMVEQILVPKHDVFVTNICFGGPDLTTLFVTTVEGHFFKAQTDRVGWAMYP